MEMPTSESPDNAALSQTLSFENRNNLRDASFSSYLNKAEENFLLKLTESTQEITSPTCTMSPDQAGRDHLRVGRVLTTAIEDEEIGVFGAEKYFQGEMEESLVKPKKDYGPKYQQEKNHSHVKSTQSSPNYLVSANMCPVKDKKEQGALSVRSESSLNSRSALLHKIPRNQAGGDMKKGSNVKSFLASLGCNCNDKTSVEVDEQLAEKSWEMTKPHLETADFDRKTKSLSSSTWAEDEIHRHLKREDCFSFPVLGSNPGNMPVKSQLEEGAPFSLEKKLSMLSDWNVVIPREEEIEIPSNGMHNDAASDASSDLFEIESFSTNGNSALTRQASDGMSSCVTPRNCYAPSEASIEWSVVTASAADFSTFSDYESVNGNSRNLDRVVRNAKIGKPAKDTQKRRPGILSGCKSHKAVRVVENVRYKSSGGHQNVTSSGQERHGLGHIMPAADTRFRADQTSKLTRHHTYDMCSLPRSHSPHLLLYSRPVL